jgi:hypothetical protein
MARYGAGDLSVRELRRFINDLLVKNAPLITRDSEGNISARFSLAAESAMYLDMVTSSAPLEHDEHESRRLARSLAALASQIEPAAAVLLAHFARLSEDTVRRIRAYLAGIDTRAAFERFVSRRPWPDRHKVVVKQLPRDALGTLADGLETNDYRVVAASIANFPLHE